MITKTPVKRRVSWADQGITANLPDEDPISSPTLSVKKISYSSSTSLNVTPSYDPVPVSDIKSPADLYDFFFESQPKKSILKNKNDESIVTNVTEGEYIYLIKIPFETVISFII